MTMIELDLGLDATPKVAPPTIAPFKTQLLKWVGNKQRFAHEIATYFPKLDADQTYFEPFLGSGAVLATLAPQRAVASDVFEPLIGIFQALHEDGVVLVAWYSDRWQEHNAAAEPKAVYEQIKKSYNASPNAADLVFLSRSCYGGVVRFRQVDGAMSTPMGVHKPVTPASFAKRAKLWSDRTRGTSFFHWDYREAFAAAKPGDVVYCDPPYTHSQTILYGAQAFRLPELVQEIEVAKKRGVFVALSIDGSKTSGKSMLELPIPEGLFEREVLVNLGGSMLKRFQMLGETQEMTVLDRLLLTY
jgi:DNA adenine methylase